jgi:pilus assembly protein CpaF
MYSNEYYNDITTKIQSYLVDHEIAVPRWRRSADSDDLAFRGRILQAMQSLRLQVDERERQAVTQEVSKRIIGLGVLQPFLEEEGLEEIIVRNGHVTVERNGQIQEVGNLADDAYFYRMARRIAEMEGIGLGAKDPKIKVGLPDGSRFAATIPPISRQGTAINIRRFARKKLKLEDLVDRGSADQETIDFLAEVASSMKVSTCFAGRPGAGKTTWLNAFSAHLPSHAQLTVVETFEELQPQSEHYHHLVVTEDEGGSGGMADAINTSVLRMRPDVLMIGEVVSNEAYQFIMALNLGIVSHTTTHAQSARMGLARLENLARKEMDIHELREVIGHGLGLVIHLSKDYDPEQRKYVRAMSELMAVLGTTDDGHYITKTLKKREGNHFTPLAGGMELFR